MPSCKHCGNEVSNEDIFCEKCGNRIDGTHKFEFTNEDVVISKKSIKKKSEEKFDVFSSKGEPVVYKSSRKHLKNKIIFSALAILAIIILLSAAISITKGIIKSNNEIKECEFGCCDSEFALENKFLEKSCDNNLATCTGNKCILPECTTECCDTNEFTPKSCENEDLVCSNNECVQKDCPFGCCTDTDVFTNKDCSNEGSCVNNKCIQESCPSEFACCLDEVDYEDKSCSNGKTCVDRECKVAFFEMISKYIKTVFGIFKIIL